MVGDMSSCRLALSEIGGEYRIRTDNIPFLAIKKAGEGAAPASDTGHFASLRGDPNSCEILSLKGFSGLNPGTTLSGI